MKFDRKEFKVIDEFPLVLLRIFVIIFSVLFELYKPILAF